MQRIKCIQELLKQIKIDQDFKMQMKDDVMLVESHNSQILKDCIKREQALMFQINQENHQLKRKVKQLENKSKKPNFKLDSDFEKICDEF